MAYGAVLGAGSYVCMYVVGVILARRPETALNANTALVRDIVSFLILLGMLIPAFLSGLSLKLVILMNGFYVLLTGVLLAVILHTRHVCRSFQLDFLLLDS
jgi:ABC-type spermidine/putrescine transport system permease subunit II